MAKLAHDFKTAWRLGVALFLTLLRVRQTRRQLMFGVSLAAMFAAFLGFTLLDSFLSSHPLLFAVYWLICGALVLLMLLLAIYDFAAVKSEFAHRSNRELADVLKEIRTSVADDDGADKKTPKG